MSEKDKLKKYSVEELLKVLRAREAKTSANSDAPSLTREKDALDNKDLKDLSSETLVKALKAGQKVIYGNDDRIDIFQITDPVILNNVNSTMSLFHGNDVIDNGNGTSTLQTQNFGTSRNLCPGERFRDQPVGCFCSGFLVAPDIIATAGHCVDNTDVTDCRFVFGFQMLNNLTAQTIINNTELYRGVRIVGRQMTNAADWALVQVDRPVINHRIAQIRRSGQVPDNQNLYVVGHPVGLPTKYADGATVRDNTQAEFFVANLDTYGGNSGSPVFSSSSHLVEGILVRGETDFVLQLTCNVSLVCPDTGCRGEDCTRTTVFQNLVPFPLQWSLAGNTAGFGHGINDGRPFWIGDFNGNGKADVLFYYPGDDNWWLGSHDGNQLQWSLAGNTAGFGHGINDGRPFWIGDFNGNGKADVLFYYPGDDNWWLGSHDGNQLQWSLAGNTAGFGHGINDGRPFWIGDFNGNGKADVLFYYPGDDNWWLGSHDGNQLQWSLAGNTAGFGHGINDGRPFWIGDFNGNGKADVLFYYPGDDNWWLGSHDGNQLQWSLAGNTAGFGHGINDGRPFWIGDFNGNGKADVLFYYPGDDNWWLGSHDGNQLQWSLAGNTAGFGHGINDGRPFWIGDFNGNGKADVLFYYPGDDNWWLGSHDGNQLQWSLAGNTAGFGHGINDGRPFWIGNFTNSNRAEVLFYYPGDDNWWLGEYT